MPLRTLRVVQYNPCSLICAHRAAEISTVLHGADVIGLTGTQEREWFPEAAGIRVHYPPRHWAMRWGFQPSPYVTKAAGGALVS